MAAPKAPLLDAAGKKAKDVTLEESIFAADVKPHVLHETVRAEQNAARSGTRGLKSRGLDWSRKSCSRSKNSKTGTSTMC